MAPLNPKEKYRAFPGNEPCPCTSGLVYKACCKKKKFRFEIDNKGKVHKSLRIHPRLKPVLENAAQEFKEILGRNPGRGDPIVFDHHLNGEADFWQQAKTIGRTAGTPEEIIFAWRRSGFLVGEHSREMMPDSEYQEWEDAIDEYFFLKEQGYDPFFVFTYLDGDEYELYKSLVQYLDQVLIVLGFAVSNPKPLPDTASYFRYTLIGRTIRSMRTIREMYNSRYDDDCLAIARSVYEAYLRLTLLRLEPTSNKRFEAIIAHSVGAFPNKTKKNGQPDYGVCIDPETGEEFEIVISNRDILKLSDFPLGTPLYYDLYPLLSGYVHPELARDVINDVNDKENSTEGDPIRAIVLILTICVLLLDEVSRSPFIKKRTHRDLLYINKRIRNGTQKFIMSDSILRKHVFPASLYAIFGVTIKQA